MTSLVLRPHFERPGVNLVEIWHCGKFVGQITPSDDECGIRIVSKHPVSAKEEPTPVIFRTVEGYVSVLTRISIDSSHHNMVTK